MFPNLEAEQRRNGLTNAAVAKILNISRPTYETKKRTGNFSRAQIVALCNYFNCRFEYLFEVQKTRLHKTNFIGSEDLVG